MNSVVIGIDISKQKFDSFLALITKNGATRYLTIPLKDGLHLVTLVDELREKEVGLKVITGQGPKSIQLPLIGVSTK